MSVELAAAKLNKAIVKLSSVELDAIVKEFYVLNSKQQKAFALYLKDVELTPKQQNSLVVADVAWTLKNVPDLSVATQNLVLSRYLKHRVSLYIASKNFSKISIKLITAMMNSKKVNAKIIGGMINAVPTQKAKRVILQKYPTSVRYAPEKVRLIRNAADMVIAESEDLARYITVVKPKPKDDVTPIRPAAEEKLTRKQVIDANRKKLQESNVLPEEPEPKPRALRKPKTIEIDEPEPKPSASRKPKIEVEAPEPKPARALRKPKTIEIDEPEPKPSASRKPKIEVEAPEPKPARALRKPKIEVEPSREESILDRLRGIKIIDADKSQVSKRELVEANKAMIKKEDASGEPIKIPKRGIKPASGFRIDKISEAETEKPSTPKRGTKKITPPAAEQFEDEDEVVLPELPEKKSDVNKNIDVKGIRARLLGRKQAEEDAANKAAAEKEQKAKEALEKKRAAAAEKVAAEKEQKAKAALAKKKAEIAEKVAAEKEQKEKAALAKKKAAEAEKVAAENEAAEARRAAAAAPRAKRPKNEKEEDDSVDEVTMPKISAKVTKQIASISEILETSIENFDTKLFQQTAASALNGEATRLDTYLNKVIDEASLVRAAKREGINSLYLLLVTIGDMETYLTEPQKELLATAEEFLNRSPDSDDAKTGTNDDGDDFAPPKDTDEEEEDTVAVPESDEDEDTVAVPESDEDEDTVDVPEDEDTEDEDTEVQESDEDTSLDENANSYEDSEDEDTEEFKEAYASVIDSIKESLMENEFDEDLLDSDLEKALSGKVSKNLDKELRGLMPEEYEEAVENNISPLLLLVLVLIPEILDNKYLPKQLRKDLTITKRFLDNNAGDEDSEEADTAKQKPAEEVESEEGYDDEDSEPEYKPRGRKSKPIDFDELDSDSDLSEWQQDDRFSGSSSNSSKLKNVIKISAEEERKYVLVLKKSLKAVFNSDKFKSTFKESIGREELIDYVLENAKNLMPADVAKDFLNLPNLALDSIFKIVVPVEKINLKKTSNVQKDFLDAATSIVKKVGDYSSRKNVSSMQRLLMSLGTKFGVDIKSISVKPGGELRMRVELNEKDQFIVVYDLDTGNYSII